MTRASVPRVSVIIPTKNRQRQLREALVSVAGLQGPDLELEIIVVDNGSADDSESVAREFGVHFVRSHKPGAAASRNVGMAIATGEFLAFLDDDDAFLPGHIRPHVELMRNRPDFAAVVGQIIVTDYAFEQAGPPYPPDLPRDGDVFARFLFEYPQVGATLARTSVRDSVGGFDSDVEGDEDWDWHLRLALTHKVGFVQVPCLHFRQRPIGATADQQWHRVRNTRRVFFRNLRRARSRRPRLWTWLRMFIRHNGIYHTYFATHALQQSCDGDVGGALIALRRAVLSSPIHVLLNLLRPSDFRSAVWTLVTHPRRRPGRAERVAPGSSL